MNLASHGDTMMHTRWAHSMAGEEYARIYSWGNNPHRKGEYEGASPCRHVDLPQTLLEPILLRYATVNGFKCRMDTKFLSFEEDKRTNTIISTVEDIVTGQQYRIRSKYLFGADGARSVIVRQLGLELEGKQSDNLAIDVLVKADLSHLVEHRKGNLHWLIQPDVEHPVWGWLGVARMVKPWHEWIFSLFPSLGYDPKTAARPSNEEYLRRVKEFIGDDTPVEIIRVSKWYINEIVARTYSRGRVFCLGDAVHRHPPMNGLGSNTCIQDSFNLAWKIAAVVKGQASPSLLDSYTLERQPVGRGIIKRANDSFRNHSAIWDALGIMSPDVEERKANLAELLTAATPSGTERRKKFRDGIEYSAHEFHALGIEMNQHYESNAIYACDEEEPFQCAGKAAEDSVLYHTPNTYPGCRLPHVWLNAAKPTKPVSTVDVAGHGRWTLLVGIGGKRWKVAARAVSKDLGIEIFAVSIGFRQDWEDVYFTWEKVKGVEEDGCVLVRPDRFVAWRGKSGGEEMERLERVMRMVLGR